MRCQHHTVHGKPCGNPLRKYNSCGVHRRLASWITDRDTPEEKAIFADFESRYTDVMKRCREASDRLEARGGNVLGIQRAFGFNLTQKPDLDLLTDPDEKEVTVTMMEGVEIIKEYQDRLDGYLISNAATIIQHQILG